MKAGKMLAVLEEIIANREEELRILRLIHAEAREEKWSARMLAILCSLTKEMPRMKNESRKIVRQELSELRS